MRAYGLAIVGPALQEAREHGWQPAQAIRLVDQCFEQVCDGFRAWGVGAVYTHLKTAPPGAPLMETATFRASPEFRRAVAERTKRLQLEREKRQEAADRAQAAEATRDRALYMAFRETLHGPAFDGLDDRELLALAADLPPFLQRMLQREKRRPLPIGLLREKLLKLFEAQRTAMEGSP